MKIKITKSQVIEAIQKEPLVHGSWIEDKNGGTNEEIAFIGDKNCSVCAVGAVLRNVMKPTCTGEQMSDVIETATNGDDVCEEYEGEIEELLENKSYLAALSCYFENQGGTGQRVKDKMRKFVEKNFPDSFRIEVPKAYLQEKAEMKQTLEQFIGGKLPFVDAHLEAEKRRQLQTTGGNQ